MLGEKFKTYLPILVLLMCAFSCKENNNPLLFFDMEKVEGNYFISQNLERVSNSLAQSSDYSKSGNYSAKIDSINPYALSYNFNNLKKGNKIIISVWEKTGAARGYLKLVDEEKNILAVKRSHLKKIERITVNRIIRLMLKKILEIEMLGKPNQEARRYVLVYKS